MGTLYFFANSTDDEVHTSVEVRGKIKPELWNPYDGMISQIAGVVYVKKGNQTYTKFALNLTAIDSVFVIATNLEKEQKPKSKKHRKKGKH